MSDGNAPKKLQLSKHSSARSKKAKKSSQSDHGYDPRNYHQNVNRHGIHSLVKFDCPVCHCKNTVNVDLENKTSTATVKCSYCMSLRPRPAELPYPFQTNFVPKLENRADAFFRFSEAYRKLANAAAAAAAAAGGRSGIIDNTSSSVGSTGAGGGGGGLFDGLEDILHGEAAAAPMRNEDGSNHGDGSDHGDLADSHGDGSEADGVEEEPDSYVDDEALVDDVEAFFDD